MFWVGVCLGLGLINVGISMVVGVCWGDWRRDCGGRIGLIEVAQNLLNG